MIKNLYDIALLKIIRNYYVNQQRRYIKNFITDYFLDFLDGIIETLEGN